MRLNELREIIPTFIRNLPVEIMVPVAVIDELLFPVLTAFDRRPEVPDYRGLTSRAERAESRVHIASLLPDRTVVYPIDQLYGVPPGKRRTNRMPRFIENKHAECSEQVVEEPYAGIAVACHVHWLITISQYDF